MAVSWMGSGCRHQAAMPSVMLLRWIPVEPAQPPRGHPLSVRCCGRERHGVVHALADRLTDDASIVLFGGMAKERPYPGSTTVTTVNGGGRRTHQDARGGAPADPGQLTPPGRRREQPLLGRETGGDREYTSETPLGRLATMHEIVDAAVFLFENTAINGVELIVDGGWHCR
jgi:hypothetical protein